MPGPSDTTKRGGQHEDPPTWLLLTIAFALTFVVGAILGHTVVPACPI